MSFGGNSDILIIAISSILEGDFFKAMHWFGLGLKIGLYENLGKFKET